MPRSNMYAIPGKDTGLHDPLPSTCETYGEHTGDSYEQPTIHGDHIEERWTCCDASEVIGEVFDCDTCLEPGTAPTGQTMPPGWIQDTNGHHCPKCQAPS